MSKRRRRSKASVLRNVGRFRLYEKHLADSVEILVSKKINNKVWRVKVTQPESITLQGLSRTGFTRECQKRLESAKRAGSPNYYEN